MLHALHALHGMRGVAGGEAFEAEEDFVAKVAAFVQWHASLAIEGAPDFDDGEFGDAADPLVADAKAAAKFAEGELAVWVEAMLQGQNLELAVVEVVEASHHFLDDFLFAQAGGWIDEVFVPEGITKLAAFGFARISRSIEGDDFEAVALKFSHLFGAETEAFGEFIFGRDAAEFSAELVIQAREFAQALGTPNGNADGAGLLGDGAVNALFYPDGGVGGEFCPELGIIKLGGADESEIAFRDQIGQREPEPGIMMGNSNYETQMCFDQCFLRIDITLAGFGTHLSGLLVRHRG
jgi:hypothetical protein